MAINWKQKSHRVFMHAIGVALLLLIGINVHADEVFLAQMSRPHQIKVEVRERLNGSVDRPVIHLFEVVKVDGKQKTFERTPRNITRQKVEDHLVATLEVDAPSANFDHFEVEIRDYESASEPTPQSFRGPVTSITATIVRAKAGTKLVDFNFNGSKDVAWDRLRTWITTAAVSAAQVTIILPDSSTVEAHVTKATNVTPIPNDQPIRVSVEFNLDRDLPVNSQVRVSFAADAFTAGSAAGLPLDLLKAPIGPFKASGGAVSSGRERDKIRLNVLEAGGNYNTSLKLDPDPTTNEKPKRKKEATLDLRLASPTSTFADEDSRYAEWTPVQLDAQMSNGKLTGDSISTNTIRLFTQVQQVFYTTEDGPTTFFRLVGEGGINADRDLRTIEYTGVGDFRWHPGFLNRVLGRDPVGEVTRIRAEFIPIGIELGHRQVRRDPLFLADDFARRLRFGAKFELLKAPYFEFSIEDRIWWRGEFPDHKFKNFFTTTFTYLPIGANTNSSAGIFFSYERGSLPPFTTQRASTLKMGFRIRRRTWRS